MVLLPIQESRWMAEDATERLAVGIFSKASGNLLRVVEMPDPRETFCRVFNADNDYNGAGAMVAEPVTLREPTEAEAKAMQLSETDSSPAKPKRKRKSG